MEIMNENRVELPALQTNAKAKQRLAWEVTGRIVEQMNRNDPDNVRKAYLNIFHHGDQVKPVAIYISEGALTGKAQYKSGSKVAEAVYEAISRVSRIDRVDVVANSGEVLGMFAPVQGVRFFKRRHTMLTKEKELMAEKFYRPSKSMYQLKVNGEAVSTHETLEGAFKARNDKVREICLELYDNDEIDTYAVEDWCFDIESDRRTEFFLDVGGGYEVDIVEVKATGK